MRDWQWYVPRNLTLRICQAPKLDLMTYFPADIDECAETPCLDNFQCVNTEGSFACVCNNGFFLNDTTCCKLHLGLGTYVCMY